MSFMKPEVYSCAYWKLESRGETTILPADACGSLSLSIGDSIEFGDPEHTPFCDYVESGNVDSAILCNGVIGRMSAPGYLYCTDWCEYDSEAEAIPDLAEMYGDDEDDSEDDSE